MRTLMLSPRELTYLQQSVGKYKHMGALKNNGDIDGKQSLVVL